MFDRLQQKWKVNGLQVILILCTFAIGGSLTGFLGKKLMNLLDIESRILWVVTYIIIVTLIWPMMVLLISFPFGQYRFFTAYLKKMGRRIGIGRSAVSSSEFVVRSRETPVGAGEREISAPVSNARNTIFNKQRSVMSHRLRTSNSELPTHIAVFASGAGSNAQKIIDQFRNSEFIKVALVVCNNPKAGVLEIAARENIPSMLIDKERFLRGDAYLPELDQYKISFIVLAGFLWKIPDSLITAYPAQIINIHPALLPRFGGKGMYGDHVHKAVIAAGEKESGITIHYVDGHYDNGDIIFQATCPVEAGDTASTLANRIHQLEHTHYPRVIEEVIMRNKSATDIIVPGN